MSFVCFLKYGHQPPPFSVCVRVCPAFPGHNILSLMPAASGTINPETQSLPARKPCLSPYIKQPVLHVGSPPLWASAPRRSRGRILCRGPGSAVLGDLSVPTARVATGWGSCQPKWLPLPHCASLGVASSCARWAFAFCSLHPLVLQLI